MFSGASNFSQHLCWDLTGKRAWDMFYGTNGGSAGTEGCNNTSTSHYYNQTSTSHYYYQGKMTWSDCQTTCLAQGYSMLCISSSTENGNVSHIVGENSWLGYSDAATEGTWEWNSGCTSTYSNWDGDEPNDYRSNEDCAEIVSSNPRYDQPDEPDEGFDYYYNYDTIHGYWFDEDCEQLLSCWCESPKPSPVPTPAPSPVPPVPPSCRVDLDCPDSHKCECPNQRKNLRQLLF